MQTCLFCTRRYWKSFIVSQNEWPVSVITFKIVFRNPWYHFLFVQKNRNDALIFDVQLVKESTTINVIYVLFAYKIWKDVLNFRKGLNYFLFKTSERMLWPLIASLPGGPDINVGFVCLEEQEGRLELWQRVHEGGPDSDPGQPGNTQNHQPGTKRS